MQTGKPSFDNMRASPVMELSMLNKLKRKRTDSPEPFSSVWAQPVKKPRGDSDPFRHTLAKPELKQELPVANPCLTTHRTPHTMQGQTDSMTHQNLNQQTHAPGRPTISASDYMDIKSVPHLLQQTPAKQMPEDISMTDAPTLSRVAVLDMTPLKQAIENEFNMQILMKHNELRLVEQELCKCQVALEQLRRCDLRPYPGSQQLSASVSAGTGPSIVPPPGYTRPSHAAPYGVSDGPYASHYRQWLLRDVQFDPVPKNATLVAEPATHGETRSIRTATTSRKSVQKSSTVPRSSSDMPKSLPNYPVSNRKNKIALLKRSSDGQLVKLVCNHCHRSDFSNAQGFLNHCRIAHKIDYKSQEQAAVDCGQLLDENELANLPPDALAAPAHKPSASRSSSTTTTPFKTHTFVHPMNVSGAIPLGSGPSAHTTPGPVRKRAIAPSTLVPMRTGNSPFTASSQAPRLSAQFAKYNLGGNLEEAISSAKQKVDLGAEEEMSPDTMDSTSPLTVASAGARTVMGTSRAGSLAPPGGVSPRPPSRKGYRPPVSRPRPSPLMQTSDNANNNTTQTIQPSSESPASPHDRSSVHLSPHTVESNPGLVSDHEDDDHGSASEDEVPQAAIAHSLGVSVGRGDCADGVEMDVRVEEGDMDEHGVVIRRNSMLSTEDRGGLRAAAGSSSRKMDGGGGVGGMDS
ncbi:hypothetical protein B0A55_03670 [Friedmanniomyces simplex]|uniref:AHC1-like C2H2 zinc-finger domain-containing protein n=1 Tax=Friedmanniomyces simplex TaxID=329884 RepID=A0A4U0XQT4_9PEZI|nr:hypothetical protein B0A55_03670 [Friedmanniomyces simplex]